MQAAKEAGNNPYPHKFEVSHTIPEYIAAFGDIAKGERQEDVTASVAGECPACSPLGSAGLHWHLTDTPILPFCLHKLP